MSSGVNPGMKLAPKGRFPKDIAHSQMPFKPSLGAQGLAGTDNTSESLYRILRPAGRDHMITTRAICHATVQHSQTRDFTWVAKSVTDFGMLNRSYRYRAGHGPHGSF